MSFSLVNVGGDGPEQPVSFPKVGLEKKEAEDLFVDTKGDKMTGPLSLGSNQITDVPTPTKPSDAANKEYVDKVSSTAVENIKSVVDSKVVPGVESFRKQVAKLENARVDLVRKTGDNSKHITEKFSAATKEITQLKNYFNKEVSQIKGAVDKFVKEEKEEKENNKKKEKVLDDKISMLGRRIIALVAKQKEFVKQPKTFEATLTSTNDVGHLILKHPSKETLTVLQVLIETVKGAWYNLYMLSPQYDFRMYEMDGNVFFVCNSKLPKNWKKNMRIIYI